MLCLLQKISPAVVNSVEVMRKRQAKSANQVIEADALPSQAVGRDSTEKMSADVSKDDKRQQRESNRYFREDQGDFDLLDRPATKPGKKEGKRFSTQPLPATRQSVCTCRRMWVLESTYGSQTSQASQASQALSQSGNNNILTPGTIADREHRKWTEHAIQMRHNPYSKEMLEKRLSQASTVGPPSSSSVGGTR